MVDESKKEYTLEEISQHNKTDDCWLIIGNINNGMCTLVWCFPSAGSGGFVVLALVCVFVFVRVHWH